MAPVRTDRQVLSERESLELLRVAGLPVVEAVAATSVANALEAADTLGYPVALKLDAPGLAHKTEVGGVCLDLASADAVREAAAELLPRGGLLVEPMAEAGVELIVGLVRDPQYGPAVLVGLGGILAEALDDTALALAPVTHAEALGMLAGLRGAAILGGVRGRPAVDRDAVAEVLVSLSNLGRRRPDIVEVDLNPVIAGRAGAVAVDALVVLDVAGIDA